MYSPVQAEERRPEVEVLSSSRRTELQVRDVQRCRPLQAKQPSLRCILVHVHVVAGQGMMGLLAFLPLQT